MLSQKGQYIHNESLIGEGVVKDKQYPNNTETIENLTLEMRVFIADIRPETIQNVLKNWVGGDLTDIIFHK